MYVTIYVCVCIISTSKTHCKQFLRRCVKISFYLPELWL